MNKKINLMGMTQHELEKYCLDNDFPKFHGEQLFRWLYKNNNSDLNKMSNIPNSLKDKINSECEVSLLKVRNKSISKIIYSQKKASENIFLKKNIPFRSFEVKKRDEKTLGELFSFFILETILLGKALKLNPYDQPAVELIKKETKKILT